MINHEGDVGTRDWMRNLESRLWIELFVVINKMYESLNIIVWPDYEIAW